MSLVLSFCGTECFVVHVDSHIFDVYRTHGMVYLYAVSN